MSQLLGYTGRSRPSSSRSSRTRATCQTTSSARAGSRATIESTSAARTARDGRARCRRAQAPGALDRSGRPRRATRSTLTIDTREQKLAQKAVTWAMRKAGLKRGVMIVMNPQTGEVLAMVSLPTYDNNKFAEGISRKDYQALLEEPGQAAPQPRHQRAVPARFDVQARDRARRALGQEAPSHRARPDEAVHPDRPDKLLGLEPRAVSGRLDIRSGFAHSSDTFFYQMAGDLGIERLAYWARQLGFGAKSGIDLPGEVPGIVPDERVEAGHVRPGRSSRARSPGRHRPGLRRRHAAPDPERVRGAGKRRQALPAPGRARVVDADGTVVRPFAPKLIRKIKASAENLKIMRARGARGRDQPPHVQPRRPADRRRRQDRDGRVRRQATPRAGCRSTTGSSPSFRSTGMSPRPIPSWP